MTSVIRRSVAVRAFWWAGRTAVVAATVSLGACASVGEGGLSALLASKEPETTVAARTTPESELEKATAYWGKEAAKNPKDKKATINYARNLKALGRKQEALNVLQSNYMFHGENKDYLSEYGRLALEAGQVNTAAQLLEQADDPINPDWRVLSARGTAMAKQGQYKEAIPFYERARELAPGQSSILNNLAMAYTMDGQAEKAEDYLRQASQMGAVDPRVKQNLAMVLSLQGKPAQARDVTTDGEAAPIAEATTAQSPKSEPASAPKAVSSPVTTASMAPDDIMRAAMKAEEARKKAAERASRKRPVTVASQEDAPPVLRDSTR